MSFEFKDNSEHAKSEINRLTIKALFEAALLIQGQAVVLAPVDSGRLKLSIDYEVDEGQLIAYVGTNVEYAIYVEFGTGEFAENGQGRKGGWVYPDPEGGRSENGKQKFFFTYGQEPQPYLRPAFRTNRSRVESIFKEILGSL